MQSYNDRWERTKRYLLRNFLANPGFQLSPVPEEDRSSSDSGSPASLPELVVEREPDRHDQAPEYYAGLARRMRRYYRQLFLDETGSYDEDSSDFEVNQSMSSTFIIDNNRGDTATNYLATEKKRNNYFDYEDVSEINDFVTEKRSADSGKDEDEFKTNETEIGERSDNYEKDEDDCEENNVVRAEKSNDFNIIDDVSEAIKVLTEEDKYNSDKDENMSETSHVENEEKTADSDKDKSEANDEVTEAERYDHDEDEDMSDANQVETEQKSADSDKDEDESEANDTLTEVERYYQDKDIDMSEANQVESEEISADSDKDEDMSESNLVEMEEKSADSDKDENNSEANDALTEVERYYQDKDVDMSEENQVESEKISADSDKDEDMSESESNLVETEEKSADISKDEDDFEANNQVTEAKRYDSDKYEDASGANQVETEKISTNFDKDEDIVADEQGNILIQKDVSQANVEEKATDSDKEEAVSPINLKQLTDTEKHNTCNAELTDTRISSHQTKHTSINNLKECLNHKEKAVENPKLIESRSGYFLMTDIDLNENSKLDYHIYNLKSVENQEDYVDLNKRIETLDEDVSTTKSDSDSGPCHVISTTVAEIHEIKQVKATRKFDNWSPVLVPRVVLVSRGVSGTGGGTEERSNASQFLGDMLAVSGEIIERNSSNNANEFNKDEVNIEEPGRDVERLLTISEVTNVSHESNPNDTGNVLKDIESDNFDKNQEEDAVDECNGHIIEDERKPRHSERQTDSEESIGPDEFNYSTLDTKMSERMAIHNDSDWDYGTDDSFEIALRRGIFESKNIRKTHAQSSDEEMSSIGEDFEPIEEMRGPRELGVRESILRASVDTQDSPVLAFERRASAEELEDVSDLNEINAFIEKDTDRKFSKDPHHTRVPQTNVLGALDGIWSVSPIELDIEQLLNEASQDNKRRRDSEADEYVAKRKRKDIAVQTSLKTRSWEDLKTNFFVGTPLVLRLCGCQDHVCTKRTNQTS